MNEIKETKHERPMWQTPVLIEDEIADLTQNTAARPGVDGQNFPGYTSYGIS